MQAADLGHRDPDPERFDGPAADLPTATLRPGASQTRHRVVGAQLIQWIADRWAWLRPRTVPMIAAVAGLVAVVGATRYLPAYSSVAPRAAHLAPRHVEQGTQVHAPCRRALAIGHRIDDRGAGAAEDARARSTDPADHRSTDAR